MERILKLFMYAIKKTNKFEGRACRMEAISYALVSTLIFIILGVLFAILTSIGFSNDNAFGGIFKILSIIVGLATFIIAIFLSVFGFGVGCRRLHDMNLSGWLQVLYFIPFINSVISIVFFVMFYFIPGTEGDNNFGKVSENY